MKLAIFDFDDTLVHEGFFPYILCTDAELVLNQAVKEGYTLHIASNNTEVTKELLETILPERIVKHFHVVCGWELSKWEIISYILNVMKEKLEYSEVFEDVVFFDDVKYNIDSVNKRLDIRTRLVNHNTGITMDDWHSNVLKERPVQ